MLDEFNKNMEQLNSDLTEALNLLEQQTYIQRNGDVFEFLTDEEKDVEEEIKNTDIETSAVDEHLYKIFQLADEFRGHDRQHAHTLFSIY